MSESPTDSLIYRPPVVIHQKNLARPKYEKQEHINYENRFIEQMKPIAEFRKLKKHYACDFGMMRGNDISALVEFKHRPGAMSYVDGVMLSLEKFTKIISFKRACGISAIFVIENYDLHYYAVSLMASVYRVSIGGRKDRGDESDMEPVIFIPAHAFLPIETFIRGFKE